MAQPHPGTLGQAAPVQQPIQQQPMIQQAPVQQQMPAAPTFGMPVQQQPVPAQQAAVAPFTTQQDLFTYTTAAYQAMGAEKGQRIMQVLTGLGISNLNELKPEQYGAFYQHVEALKAGA